MCLLASILAPTWRPRAIQRRPRSAQERPRAAQERPRAAQELPKSAKDGPGAPKSRPRQPKSFPEADQDGQELPRTRPGLVQDLPRSALESTHYPRLEKNSQLHHAILQNSPPCHKAANFKNERRRYSPQGGLQSAALRGRRVEREYEVFLSFRILLPDSSSRRFLSSPS